MNDRLKYSFIFLSFVFLSFDLFCDLLSLVALHAAGFAQHADIVALLLAKGANIEVKNDLGLVPKQEAFDKETRKVAKMQ